MRIGSSTLGDAAFVLVQFLGEVAAGYVGGRFGAPQEAGHGSLAALTLFAVVAGISLAGGADPGLLALVGGAAVALALGASGGVLAAARRMG